MTSQFEKHDLEFGKPQSAIDLLNIFAFRKPTAAQQ